MWTRMTTRNPLSARLLHHSHYLQTSFEVRAAKNSDIWSLLYAREQNECMALKKISSFFFLIYRELPYVIIFVYFFGPRNRSLNFLCVMKVWWNLVNSLFEIVFLYAKYKIHGIVKEAAYVEIVIKIFWGVILYYMCFLLI